MSWTCEKCRTKHDTDDERAACRRSQRTVNLIAMGILLAIFVFGVGGKIAWSVYAYGDWTCAFAECRKLKP